jgi:cell division protein FtsB
VGYGSIRKKFYNSMRELQEKQRTKERLYSMPVLVILGIVVIFLLRGTYQVLQKDVTSANSVKEMEAKVAQLTDRQEQLKRNIDKLSTDDGIDAEIKDKFSVSKPGEHVAIIVDEKAAASTSVPEETNIFKRMWHALRGL